MRIAHLITRMIVGGAQENTLFSCEDLIRVHGDEVLLVTGPAIGPEGDLLQQGRGGEGRKIADRKMKPEVLASEARSIRARRVSVGVTSASPEAIKGSEIPPMVTA